MTAINASEAKQAVLDWLAALEPQLVGPLVLIEAETIEKPFGWVFFYDSRPYVETKEYSAQLAGNAPLILDRNDGRIHETGTAYPIEEYEKNRD